MGIINRMATRLCEGLLQVWEKRYHRNLYAEYAAVSAANTATKPDETTKSVQEFLNKRNNPFDNAHLEDFLND